MTSVLVSRLTAWLCLALIFLTGLTPAQGFVLCIEADGCVSVELKATEANCGGCEGHDESEPAVRTAASSGEADPCQCVDLAVPGTVDEQVKPSRTTEIHVGMWIALAPEVRFQQALLAAFSGRAPPAPLPRVADALAHLRSVVLLV